MSASGKKVDDAHTADKSQNNKPSKEKTPTPAIAVPKGGGAIRGIGEKFQANPVTGTASFSIPIYVSPGREGFDPDLTLSYDSGNGNGPFGFGWSIGSGFITRRTNLGLPQYLDDEGSDVFILTGAEDLVAAVEADGSRQERIEAELGYVVHFYRPRIETENALIERWTNFHDNSSHWRYYSPTNVLTIYGLDPNSRIFNPESPDEIFSWLISEIRDVKGNAIKFEYKAENHDGADIGLAHRGNRQLGANRYLKHILYGNSISLLDQKGTRPVFLDPAIDPVWHFQLVFDYGEHTMENPTPSRPRRGHIGMMLSQLSDLASSFEQLASAEESTDFSFSDTATAFSAYTFLLSGQQHGYKRESNGYIRKSLPPVNLQYSTAELVDELQTMTSENAVNFPGGFAPEYARPVDLFGEGITGLLYQTEGAWYYKRNITPLPGYDKTPSFAELEQVQEIPNLSLDPEPMLLDVTGDGSLSLVDGRAGAQGFCLADNHEGWLPFQPFRDGLNIALNDADIKLVDLNGDGTADIFSTSGNIWHRNDRTNGFSPPRPVYQLPEENQKVGDLFNDDQFYHFADFSGDGLVDIVLVRNSEISYFPNLGYGRFGKRIVMDNAPFFDSNEAFNPERLIFGDIDGSGTTDIIYISSSGVNIYFNQSGNAWSQGQPISSAPIPSSNQSVTAMDLLGNGTMCLVFSDPSRDNQQGAVQYIDLMGSRKPHLLTGISNNMGLTTTLSYATSTKFYLQDKMQGTPWISRLAFPVHVLESIEAYDHISRNAFTSRYTYHHGYFDAKDREFRGFGMVEQWDSDSITALSQLHVETASNPARSSAFSLPPVYTKTWFHLGAPSHSEAVSDRYVTEYFQTAATSSLLLPDTLLPENLAVADYHDACRSLKGQVLRQEVYADDGDVNNERSRRPYSITESNFSLQIIQESGELGQRPGVFKVVPRETIKMEMERSLDEPRTTHQMILATNEFGQVTREVFIAYGRKKSDAELPTNKDRAIQEESFITLKEHTFTNTVIHDPRFPHQYHLPADCETKTSELTGVDLSRHPLPLEYFMKSGKDDVLSSAEEIEFHGTPTTGVVQKRTVEWSRNLMRKDDLSGLLPFTQLQPKAIVGQSYSLAFTDQQLTSFIASTPELSFDISVLLKNEISGGGYIHSRDLIARSLFPSDVHGYWIPSSEDFFVDPSDNSGRQSELEFANENFYLPRVNQTIFNATSKTKYDAYNLYVLDSTNPLGNRSTVGEVDSNGNRQPGGFDYRVLQPSTVSDENRNRTEVAFDALGMVVGIAIRGKPEETVGDTLEGFEPDLDDSTILQHLDNPADNLMAILFGATARYIYDSFAYSRSGSLASPVVTCELKRLTHADPNTQVHQSFTFCDGHGREIQKKIQTHAGPVAYRNNDGILLDPMGQPVLTEESFNPRWITSGWVIVNNKGDPVAQYEPYFTHLHSFEYDTRVGATKIQFYDPLSRPFAALLPNDTYSKSTWTPWSTKSYDGNDTVLQNPQTDSDLLDYTARYFGNTPLLTWLDQRTTLPADHPHRQAAEKTIPHADTPSLQYFDALGRNFLQVADIHTSFDGHAENGTHRFKYSRTSYDIEGKIRAVYDGEPGEDDFGRLVETYEYDMLGRVLRVSSMDSGTKFTLYDALDNPIVQWDDKGLRHRFQYDVLGRPTHKFVKGDGFNAKGMLAEALVERQIYGELHAEADGRNIRGKRFMVLDQSGISSDEHFDFKGNVILSNQQVRSSHKFTLDWITVEAAIPLDHSRVINVDQLGESIQPFVGSERYHARKTWNALNKPLAYTVPSSSAETTTTFRLNYDLLSLRSIDCNLRNAKQETTNALLWTPMVKSLDFDARGKRSSVEYGNGVRTSFQYGLSGELTQLFTIRPKQVGQRVLFDILQDLRYTYDPSFNITNILDLAQQTLYYKNEIVEPRKSFTYDSTYRLIAATGREHLGQNIGAPTPYSSSLASREGPQPGDASAMGSFLEQYVYDTAGNMLGMKHESTNTTQGAKSNSWTRRYSYDQTSLLQSGRAGNRLSSSSVGQTSETFTYDRSGNSTYMPHLGGRSGEQNMQWDFANQLKRVDLGGGGTAYYVYNHLGQRVKKVIERGLDLTEERLYLGDIEVFSRIRSGEVAFQRETLHVTSDAGRIALVETRTVDLNNSDRAPQQVIRYQSSDHLNSSSIETDDEARILTYEEYSPFGSTTYSATSANLELPKRYRFTFKERDEETGLVYFGSRFLCDWLARWISSDPIGLKDGLNTYQYVSNNPVKLNDPTGKAAQDRYVPETINEMSTRVLTQRAKQWAKGHFEPVVNTLRGADFERTYHTMLNKQGNKVLRQAQFRVNQGGGKVIDLVDVGKGYMMELKSIGVTKYLDKKGNLNLKHADINNLNKRLTEAFHAAERQLHVVDSAHYIDPELLKVADKATIQQMEHKLIIGIEHGGKTLKEVTKHVMAQAKHFELDKRIAVSVVRQTFDDSYKVGIKALVKSVGKGAVVGLGFLGIGMSTADAATGWASAHDDTDRWLVAARTLGNAAELAAPVAPWLAVAGFVVSVGADYALSVREHNREVAAKANMPCSKFGP